MQYLIFLSDIITLLSIIFRRIWKFENRSGENVGFRVRRREAAERDSERHYQRNVLPGGGIEERAGADTAER